MADAKMVEAKVSAWINANRSIPEIAKQLKNTYILFEPHSPLEYIVFFYVP
jgi:hypothetical protein